MGVFRDWIEDRDDETFVHTGKKDRSGWEKHRSMSDWLVPFVPQGSEKEIKKVYEVCNNRARNMSKKKIHLVFDNKTPTAKTDGKRVTLGTGIMDDTTKEFSEKMSVMLGAVTHEMAHVMHSEFHHLNGILKHKPFERAVYNILEDERIEAIVGDDTPGYAQNLADIKKYFLDEKYTPAMEDPELTEEEKAMQAVFDAFFKFVRYPKNIDENVVTENEAMIDDIKAALTPFPKTPNETLTATGIVASIINLKMKEEEEKGGGGPADGEGDGEALSDLKKKLGEMFDDSTPDSAKAEEDVDVSEVAKKVDYTETHLEDQDERVVFRKGKPSLMNYKGYQEEVKKDAGLMARFMTVNLFREDKTLHGLRTGKLEDNRIVDAVHGVPTVYTAKTVHPRPEVNVVLVIDESGSMMGEKSRDAARVAVLLEMAFKKAAIGQLFIYGFTSDAPWDGATDHNQVIRYREPGLDVKAGLGDVRGRANNRDGHCIRAISKRVRSFTKEPMIMFIISDGAPSASGYGGHSALMDTRDAVIKAEKMNFFPIQIGIESISVEEQKIMFKTFVNYHDSHQMVLELRKLLVRSARRFLGM